MVNKTPGCSEATFRAMAAPAGTVISAPSEPVHVNTPALYTGLLNMMILVAPWYNFAVIAGKVCIVPMVGVI